MTILLACIGNIFLGDDAFGVEMAGLLARESWPESVIVRDFGIRGLDLVYALLEDRTAFVLVDAVPRGEAPGTLYSMEIDLQSIDRFTPAEASAGEAALDAHGLHPLRVLQMVRALGGSPRRVFLIGCEPTPLDEQEEMEGRMGLSEPVRASLPDAVSMVCSLIEQIQKETENDGQETSESAGDRRGSHRDDYAVAGH